MIAGVRPDWGLVAVGVLGLALMIVLPIVLDLFALLQVTLYAIFGILALSLAFIWGYGGILCFGHSAFFGLGAYTYAVAVINIGESTGPLLLAMLLPAALAAALGYFMFYARISDIYVGVITLTLTLIFYNCINSTAGPAYHIGNALLGGFNGMPNVASLNIPFLPDDTLEPLGMFLLCGGLLLVVYFCIARLAGDPLRPGARCNSGERTAGRVPGLRCAAAQACGVLDRRRARRLGRLPVRRVGQLR